MFLMTACSWQNKFCDGNSVRSVRRFVLHVIRSMVIFVLGFFFCKHLRRLSLVSDGGDGWRHFTSMLLPDRVCLVSHRQLLPFWLCNLEKTRTSALTTNQWKKTKANVPSNPKQRASQVDSTNVPNPQHMETHCGKQNFQKFPCLPPKTFNFLSKPPQKNSWQTPAPWNKYCQTSKVPPSMVHQSQIDPNCICPQYEHQTMLRCPYHWSPGHHHVAKRMQKATKRWWPCVFPMFFFVVNWSIWATD